MTLGFDHMTIAVPDVEEAERFLAVLGFRHEKTVLAQGETIADYMGIPGWVSDHVTLVLEGVSPRQEIQLLSFHHPKLSFDDGAADLARPGFNHVCFKTDDLDGTLERFAAAGYKPRNAIMEFHDRRLVFFDGPAGTVFELAEWTTADRL